jgi:hypothetical protein
MMTVVSERPVGPVEERSQERRNREHVKRIGPPDVLHRVAIDVSPLKVTPAREEEPQVPRDFTRREIQLSCHPVGPERSQTESSLAKHLFSERDERAAYAAGIIVEYPSRGRAVGSICTTGLI